MVLSETAIFYTPRGRLLGQRFSLLRLPLLVTPERQLQPRGIHDGSTQSPPSWVAIISNNPWDLGLSVGEEKENVHLNPCSAFIFFVPWTMR